jgi:hypothetical protein
MPPYGDASPEAALYALVPFFILGVGADIAAATRTTGAG